MSLSPYIVTVITKEDAPYNVIPNASIEIRERLANGTSGDLSLIFEDSAGLFPITQTGATADTNGQFVFYAESAEYNAVYQSQTVPVDMGLTPSTLPTALINDLSQEWAGTVSEYKNSTVSFPISKLVYLEDREALFKIIAGVGTADEYEIIANTNTTQSAALIVTDKTTIKSFGVDMTGVVESSEALRVALNYNVIPTEGNVLINPITPLVINDDKNTAFLGMAKGITKFSTTIDDGSRIFEYSGQFQTATNFSISGLNGDPYDFTGMVLGNAADVTSFVRSQFDAKATFCEGTAIEMRGFLNEVNLLTKNCGRGFKGRELNANTMILRSEDDERGIDIEEIFGTNIEQLTLERVSQQVSTNPSRIDKFTGLNINAMYTEGGGWTTTPLEFGQSVGGRSVNINAGSVTGVTDDGTPMLSFVDAEAVTANLDVSTGSNPAVVNFGADCNYVDSKVVGVYSTPDTTRNKQFTQDNSLSVQVHANYMGDTYLDHGLATFPTKSDGNVVTTEDTTIFRSGDKGIRVTANAGTHLAVCSLQRQINLFENTAKLSGKTVRAYAWVWVPDLPLFADRTIQPAFGISAQGTSSSFPAAQRAMVAGQWNLVESEDLVIPVGWGGVGTDKLSFDFYVGYSTSTFPDSSYFITVDSVFLTEVNADIRDIMQGRFRESAKYSGITTDGSVLSIQSQTYQSLTASYINITQGEVIVYRELPSAGGKVGYVCTTSGTLGGTAVFKAFGAIDA